MDDIAARSLLNKLKAFIEEDLDQGERVLFGQLIAPGIARAYPPEDEVVGFTAVEWAPSSLAESLVVALRQEGVRVMWGDR